MVRRRHRLPSSSEVFRSSRTPYGTMTILGPACAISLLECVQREIKGDQDFALISRLNGGVDRLDDVTPL